MYEFIIQGVVLDDETYERFQTLYPGGVPKHIVKLVKEIEREDIILPIDSATLTFAERATGLPAPQAIVYLARLKLSELSSTYRKILPIVIVLEGKDAQ